MRREYKAIVDAGFILQLDCPDLAMLRHMVYLDLPLVEYRKIIAVNVAALNHAVRDLPPERMRMHVCWGSTVAPHHTDVEIKDIVDIVLSARPQAVSFPGANPRHEHEWKIWRDVKLPAGKIIIPGVIDSTSNFVEHPELVADRIMNYAGVGRAREHDRRRRLRLRHLCRPRAGRHQDRVDEARFARRRRKARVEAVVGEGGVIDPLVPAKAGTQGPSTLTIKLDSRLRGNERGAALTSQTTSSASPPKSFFASPRPASNP